MLSMDDLKNELGISTSEVRYDADLRRMIRAASATVRNRVGRYLFCRVHSVTSDGAKMTVVAPGHGLHTNDVALLTGTNCFPVLDGEHEVTVVDPDTWTSPVALATTTAGTDGVVHLRASVEFEGNRNRLVWIPERFVPVYDIISVSIRVSNEEWRELDFGSDYSVSTDDQSARAISLEMLNGVWPQFRFRRNSRSFASGLPTVYVTAYCGLKHFPPELEEAVRSLCCDLWERQGVSRDVIGESYGGTSRTRLSGTEKMEALLSPTNILESWRARM